MLAIIKEVCGDERAIVAGDFNFFPDRDGGKQRAILTDFQLASFPLWDVGGKMWSETSQTARPIEGTFVGYDHDEFKCKDLSQPSSRLDHIFLKGDVMVASHLKLCTETMVQHLGEMLYLMVFCTQKQVVPEPPELSCRDLLPSDHLALLVELQLGRQE